MKTLLLRQALKAMFIHDTVPNVDTPYIEKVRDPERFPPARNEIEHECDLDEFVRRFKKLVIPFHQMEIDLIDKYDNQDIINQKINDSIDKVTF